MIAVTVNSTACFLVTEEPNWSTLPKLTVDKRTTNERGATGREERRPLSATLICDLEGTATLSLAAMNSLRNALQVANAEPILVPVWPLARAGDAWSPANHVSSDLLIAWQEGWSSYQIFDLTADDEITAGDWDHVAPLLWGYFSAAPAPAALTHRGLTVKFSFSEDGPAKYALHAAPTFPVLPAPAIGGFSPPAFPWELNWAQPVKSGTASVSIARDQVGPGRSSLAICYPQNPERPLEGIVTLVSAAEIGGLLSWWTAQNADAGTQWVSTWLGVTRLTGDAAAGDTRLIVESAAALGANCYIALQRGGILLEYAKVSSIAHNTLILAGALHNDFPASRTHLSLAMLGRHADSKLALTFRDFDHADAALSWRELSAEYAVGDGETRGTTIGALPAEGWLFEFEVDYGGMSVFHRATNYERDSTAASHTWTSRILDFEDMVQSLDLEDHELTLSGEYWPAGPWDQFLPGALEARVILRLYKCTVDGSTGSNLVQCWEGTVKAGLDGPKINATVSGPSALFKLQLPGDVFGPACNARLFDVRCGLSSAAWEFSAVVAAKSGNTLTIGTITRTGGLPSGFGFVHWFALGFLEATVSSVIRRWAIYDSAVLDGSSHILLTLRKPYTGAVSDAVSLWPGCDKRRETCMPYNASTNPTGKFNNYANFRGFPFIPDRAPQFVPLKKAPTTYGKK